MLEGFRPITLTIGSPTVTITTNGLTVNRTAIERLERSSYVILMLNDTLKQLAIVTCEKSDPNATRFFSADRKIISARWNNSGLLNKITRLMEWDVKKHGYRTVGDHIESEKALIFDLTKAEIFDSRTGNEENVT